MPRVLIVDDDKFTRSVLMNVLVKEPVLRSLGVEVLTAEDGEEGIAMYDAHRPQVVIVDLLMPKKDGFSVCETIRTRAEGAGVHLAAMSGVYRDAAVAYRLKEQYGARLFTKPYQLQDLTRYITDLLSRDEQAPEPINLSEAAAARSGSLSERPLSALLFDLWEEQATGRLELERGKVKKEVGLAFGHPVFVSSNLRGETLGYFLTEKGILSEEDHTAALERASSEKGRLGAALLTMGLLTPEQLIQELTDQVRFKLRQCLRWRDGSFSFRPSEKPPTGAHGNALDMAEVVLGGLKESSQLAQMPERVADLLDCPLELTERGERLLPGIRLHMSEAFADLWVAGNSAEELADRGVDKREVLAVLDALSLCEAVRAGEAPAESSEAQAADPSSSGELYSLLFDDSAPQRPSVSGALPIEVSEAASGDTEVTLAGVPSDGQLPPDLKKARGDLLKEYLRIQDVSHYEVLRVDPEASPASLAAALAERRSKFSFEFFARFDLGRDYAKLEEVQAAYDRAGEVLLDDEKRRAYDAELQGTLPALGIPVLDAELAARQANELLARGDMAAARVKLESAIEAAPKEAAYHAALGWVIYAEEGRDGRAADQARPHLNQALALDPDNAAAHEYKGIITAELGADDAEAAFHLERALEAEPSRIEALEALEALRHRRGELRPLERQYRRLLHSSERKDAQRELALWLKLAQLYVTDLDEPDSARSAYRAAERLDPENPGIQAALAELSSDTEDPFFAASRRLRDEWLADPSRDRPGKMLVSAALKASRWDAAFVAASALVFSGSADQQADELYRRYRPRFLIRVHRRLEGELWRRAVHPDDAPLIGSLFELLEPIVREVAPLGLAQGELDDAAAVSDEDLPASFLRVRSYVASVLGVDEPPVYARSDFERQIHVGATSPPVLLAGDDAIAAPERSELGFRLGRAMTYLKPGRALAGAYPGRLLRQVVLAAYETVSSSTASEGDQEELGSRIKEAICQLPKETLERVHELVGALSEKHRTLDLNEWARALARTGDRVGLLLCADLPAALRFAADAGGPEAQRDLFAFALSSEYLSLRADLGLSVDV